MRWEEKREIIIIIIIIATVVASLSKLRARNYVMRYSSSLSLSRSNERVSIARCCVCIYIQGERKLWEEKQADEQARRVDQARLDEAECPSDYGEPSG